MITDLLSKTIGKLYELRMIMPYLRESGKAFQLKVRYAVRNPFGVGFALLRCLPREVGHIVLALVNRVHIF